MPGEDPNAKNLPGPGTYKLSKTGAPEPITPRPVKGEPIAGLASAEAKRADGATGEEFTDLERQAIDRKKWLDDEAELQKAAAAEEVPKVTVVKNFGALKDSVQIFVLLHEQVGPFSRKDHKFITIQDLCQFDVVQDKNGLFSPDYQKPRVKQTLDNRDRLIAIGAIAPVNNVRA